MIVEFFKKIRWVNLLIIAFTMYAIRFGVLYPFFKYNNLELQLNEFYFVLLVLAAVFIAAGGYIINDFFDKKIDELNNPIKTEDELEEEGDDTEETFCCRKAMRFYNIFTIIGVSLGTIVSLLINQYMFSTIFFLVAGLLWFYSSSYKLIPLLGNVIVAILSALVPMLVVVFEVPLIIEKYKDLFIENNSNLMIIMYFVGGFAAFAFLLTLIREIVKDIEDVVGDKVFVKKTIPVVFGKTFASVFSGIICAITISFLYYIQTHYIVDIISFWYILILLIAPLSYVIFRLIANTTKDGMHLTSTILKIIMLSGISYSLIIYLSLS
jgi:4-hydroxybenzoate polyprenyltransferase